MKQTSTVLVNSIAIGFVLGVLLGSQFADWRIGCVLFVLALIVHLVVMTKQAKCALLTVSMLFLAGGCLVTQLSDVEKADPLKTWTGQKVLITGVSTKEARPISLDEKTKQVTYTVDVLRLQNGAEVAKPDASVLVTVYADKT